MAYNFIFLTLGNFPTGKQIMNYVRYVRRCWRMILGGKKLILYKPLTCLIKIIHVYTMIAVIWAMC